MLENARSRTTKIISELRDRSYQIRLKECGLTTMYAKRLREDHIEMSKIQNCYENVDTYMFLI